MSFRGTWTKCVMFVKFKKEWGLLVKKMKRQLWLINCELAVVLKQSVLRSVVSRVGKNYS